MNLNPDSTAFFKVALCSIDNHSRMGWFISKNSLEKTIEDLKTLQSKYGIYCELAETDEDNKGPIKMLMEEEDFPVYYG